AGKTGTAETNVNDPPHAWYTGYAPYINPEITVTVLFEKAGEGSSVAAPVARDIMNYYFTYTKPIH
ncbi:MAG: penicillin-binding transpeptidase domain-containing protein, partial [bacterium]|nr:penicillin-binding transpeptidase domain-containing protein [bacterium]